MVPEANKWDNPLTPLDLRVPEGVPLAAAVVPVVVADTAAAAAISLPELRLPARPTTRVASVLANLV